MESLQIQEEKAVRGYDNHARSESAETILEEILGWQEILTKISEDIAKESIPKDEKSQTDITNYQEKAMRVFGTEQIATELAYLKNAYNAELMGVEKNRFGMKVLTIKAMKIAAKMGNIELFDSVSENESKSIDLLMCDT